MFFSIKYLERFPDSVLATMVDRLLKMVIGFSKVFEKNLVCEDKNGQISKPKRILRLMGCHIRQLMSSFVMIWLFLKFFQVRYSSAFDEF